MGQLLTEQLPEWEWAKPEGGSALWIRLPDTDARVFAQVALRHGVEVVAGRAMDPRGAHDDHLRLPFSLSGAGARGRGGAVGPGLARTPPPRAATRRALGLNCL